ncbi:MAG: hypothetical protein KAJ05_06220 [Candidatus Latescibacteria bacterium]|nr:hypothetical protein [Candidatus Latescibacterota bacterium]MCK5328678.1 hypothetical protein [Candidatus Latescibacterota bacterium]MCK5381917.1 hypothetical protein [Candidatus Latescibacterota bacterium]MCK5526727.1 hypothetical protein [Candidatus Latescibacterota bacterium]MCK5733051.1 hypothetical protein [Candidatus Latescibacterota bacterium]
MKWASVFLTVFFLLLLFFSQGGRTTRAYEELKPDPGRVTVFQLVGSEKPSSEHAARLREMVRSCGGVTQEMYLDELPAALSCGSDRVKVERLPWVLLVDATGRIRYESTGADLSELSAWVDFLKQQPVTDIDESTWGKIKELFR